MMYLTFNVPGRISRGGGYETRLVMQVENKWEIFRQLCD